MAMGSLFALLCGFILTPAMVAQPLDQQAPAQSQTLTWQLSNPKVVKAGISRKSQLGTLVLRHTIEALATATGNTPIKNGRFLVRLSAFSPKNDMPGQKAGLWYIQGHWAIVDENAPLKARKARYSSAIVKGLISAELPFNPVTEPGDFIAQLRVPMSPQAGEWAKGQGSFTGNEKFAGVLSLTLQPRLAAN
jgi:hypothetical protein